MKHLRRLFPYCVIAAAAAAFLFGFVIAARAAAEATVTESLQRIQCEIPAGRAQAFFEKSTTVGGQTFKSPWTEVSWQVGAEKTVTVNGTTYTYAEVMAAIVAIAQQEKTASETPPAP